MSRTASISLDSQSQEAHSSIPCWNVLDKESALSLWINEKHAHEQPLERPARFSF